MYPRRVLVLLTLALCPTAIGCLGPIALQRSRIKYNEAIQRTADEQLLLNVVRLRYRDTPSFMELSSLSTQFAFEEGAFANGRLIERPTTADYLNIGFAADASERPTITYDPLRGQEFVKRLVSPLSEETVILLIRSGWSISRVLRMTVQELNGVENARRASGPTPSRVSPNEYLEFQEAVAALRESQMGRAITIGYEDKQKAISGPVQPEMLDADAIVNAAKEGWRIEPREERVQIAPSKLVYGSEATKGYSDKELLDNYKEQIKSEKLRKPIRVRFREDDGKFVVVSGDFGDLRLRAYSELNDEADIGSAEVLVPCIVEYPDQYVITGPTQSLILSWDPRDAEIQAQIQRLPNPPAVTAGRYELEIEPRSLMGTLYYLSHAVRVPEEDEAAGLVTTTLTEGDEIFDWTLLTGDLLFVQCCRHKPKSAAVAVKYRGNWFFIDDHDQNSKATFTLLMQLFELQAGGGATGTKPVLTLPVGI